MITTPVAATDGDLANVDKLLNYDFVNAFLDKDNTVSCLIDGVNVGETDTDGINIGANGVDISTSYTVTSSDISGSTSGSVYLSIAVRNVSSGGASITSDLVSTDTPGAINATVSIPNKDIASNTIYARIEITDIIPE